MIFYLFWSKVIGCMQIILPINLSPGRRGGRRKKERKRDSLIPDSHSPDDEKGNKLPNQGIIRRETHSPSIPPFFPFYQIASIWRPAMIVCHINKQVKRKTSFLLYSLSTTHSLKVFDPKPTPQLKYPFVGQKPPDHLGGAGVIFFFGGGGSKIELME